MELKTLKDIDADYDLYKFEQNIKQEAINWIKALEQEAEEHRKATKGYEGMDCCGDSQIDWITHFFNITEDDLK